MVSKRWLLLLTAISCTLLWQPTANAQSANGAVSGTAKDSGGSLLHGARVQLNPIGKQTVTDTQGQFRITDVPPGDYTVTVAYVGFEPFTKSIKVEGAQVAGVDAVLQVASRVFSGRASPCLAAWMSRSGEIIV